MINTTLHHMTIPVILSTLPKFILRTNYTTPDSYITQMWIYMHLKYTSEILENRSKTTMVFVLYMYGP